MKPPTISLYLCIFIPLILGSCVSPPPPLDEDELTKKEISLFYVTSRAIQNPGSDPYSFYGYKQAREKRLGKIKVAHQPNQRKTTYNLTGLKELNKNGEEEFWSQLDSSLASKEDTHGKRKMFLYIHGFNTTFSEAAFTGAKLSRSFQGDTVACLYSWPSRGKVTGYGHDQDRVAISSSTLAKFLVTLKEKQPDTDLVVIAHSLGNKVLAEALKIFSQSPNSRGAIANVAFFAADVSREDFINHYSPIITDVSQKRSIYISRGDLALQLSKRYHGAQRLGDAQVPVTLPNYDTIDVTRVDDNFLGHGYIRNNPQVSHDLFYNLGHGLQASKRYGLRKVKAPSGPSYWELNHGE